MFQAKLRGWKRLAAGLLLVPGLTSVGTEYLWSLSQSHAQERSTYAPNTNQAETAERMMKQAREAFDRGDYAKARDLAEKVKAMNISMPFWSETPDQLLTAIQAKIGGRKATNPPKVTNEDPRVLLTKGRAALEAGKLEEALDYARQAEANGKKARWGLFEDSPTSLMKDVQSARSKRDRLEADRLLAQARTLYEKRARSDEERAENLDSAKSMAQQAQMLHGPYSIWDLGDRPQSLIKEIESARAKLRVPVAKKPVDKKSDKDPRLSAMVSKNDPKSATGSKPAQANPIKTVEYMPKLDPTPGPDRPDKRTEVVKTESARPNDRNPSVLPGLKLPDDPPALLPNEETAKPVVAGANAQGNMRKSQALQLMQQARAKEVAGKFIEAKELLLAAEKQNATFTGDEESPGMALQALNAAAQKRMHSLCKEAHEAILKKDQASLQHAEKLLTDAEMIALGMGLDAFAINEHRTMLSAARGALMESEPPLGGTVTRADQNLKIPGLDSSKGSTSNDSSSVLLKQAREELRRGETKVARQIVNQILNGTGGNKDEAVALLKTIDAEEFEQKERTARRAYENGVYAFQNRKYEQALEIFKLVDANLLTPNQRASMSELMASANKAVAAKTESQTIVRTGSKQTPGQPPVTELPEGNAPRQGADSLLSQQEAMQHIQFQKLRAEGLKVESEATARFGKGETDAALQDLQNFILKVKLANLDPAKTALLVRPIETRVERLKVLKHQTDFLTKETKDLRNFKSQMTQEALHQQHKQEEVAKMVKDYQRLMAEGKFQEANKLALQARELDPDNPVPTALVQMSQMMYRKNVWEETRAQAEEWRWKVGNDAFKLGPAVNSDDPVAFDKDRWSQIRARNDYRGGIGSLKSRSQKEREIETKLQTQPVNLDFKATPLEDAIRSLQVSTGMNIMLDRRALSAKAIDPKMPITLTLNGIPMKSGLNVLVDQANLRYVIEDDIVKITTQERAVGKLGQRVFPVADLVVSVPNHQPAGVSQLDQQLERAMQFGRPNIGNSGLPYTPALGLNDAQTPAGSSPSTNFGVNGGKIVNQPSQPNVTVSKGNSQGTIEESLIRLITRSVKPDTWVSAGGAGTIEYYPLGMALVINQTPDVIGEVEELLDALRRLQDIEVAIEVRMISLSETFYERIGLDFAMNVPTNVDPNDEAAIINDTFAPQGFINKRYRGIKGTVIGMQAPGVPTTDLDLPIRATSFASAIPPFGGYTNNVTNNGGLSLGLAFLNDIQVYMFLEAAQGDSRTNVMQAPKLTMFNGQTATININDTQFFVVGVSVVQVNGQLIFNPQNFPFQIGVTMTMQPAVSGDRRFVRLNIGQSMTSVSSANVTLFPITTIVTPTFEGGFQGQPIPFTQFVQQPTFATINVETTVVVPDGGTVVMGGLKTLSEGRNEFGPPVLSKIPYVNRLFKNVGYGREARSLLMMVTPRIIINEEEEKRQTGIGGPPEG